MQDDGSVEFHSSTRNDHGTGYDMIVSNPLDGRVDITIYQVICHEVPEEPSVSLSLPVTAAAAMLQALNAGILVGNQSARLKKFH